MAFREHQIVKPLPPEENRLCVAVEKIEWYPPMCGQVASHYDYDGNPLCRQHAEPGLAYEKKMIEATK